MKQILKILMIFIMIFSLMMPITVFAVGDGNIDSGGGGMGDGTSTDKWSPGYDGVRVTVVRASDHAVVTTPIDLTNKSPTNVRLHFGKVSKLSYNGGRAISPSGQSYTFVNPVQEMPRIVSTNGSSNIEAIKKYFCSEYTIKRVAEITGMNYEILIGGDYKLLLEPMAYYTFQSVMIA